MEGLMGKVKLFEIEFDGDVAYVPLTRGRRAVVDATDASLVSGRAWTCTVQGYARRAVTVGGKPRQKNVWMHRLILNAPDGSVVDHVNGDTLDNRRANLRLATPIENARNRKMQSTNTTGLKGVMLNKRTGTWRSKIRTGGCEVHLGTFKTAQEAHAAYCDAAKQFHGDFARFE
jgi:hypothetical protein